MAFDRSLNLSKLLKLKSFFLFGPRSTGKSYLVRESFPGFPVVDLLRSDYFLRLSDRPSALRDLIPSHASNGLVIVDEIQKVPALLDEVHSLIEENSLKFLLTGSSARKLKLQSANMLGGRAWRADLFPLTSAEIPGFQLENHLLYGGLPHVVKSDSPREELRAYVDNYISLEIQMEGWVRKLAQFSRFINLAALCNGQILNFTKLGQDAGVPPSTIREYYYLLEDTLMGFFLPPWTESGKRKAVSTAKFYFFDTGVFHQLVGTKNLDPNTDLFGRTFEHWLVNEVRAFLSYNRKDEKLYFWRAQTQQEVDLVVGNEIAIEIKASRKVNKRDLKGLTALMEEERHQKYFLISQDPIPRAEGGVNFWPWQKFIEELWAGKIL